MTENKKLWINGLALHDTLTLLQKYEIYFFKAKACDLISRDCNITLQPKGKRHIYSICQCANEICRYCMRVVFLCMDKYQSDLVSLQLDCSLFTSSAAVKQIEIHPVSQEQIR